jgi:Uncharacterized protein conserved in bacteria (DUF2188)
VGHGDIETFYRDGSWWNRAEGTGEQSTGYESKEEAVRDGRDLALERGVAHTVQHRAKGNVSAAQRGRFST